MNAELFNIFLLSPNEAEVNMLFLKTGKVSLLWTQNYWILLTSETQEYEHLESQYVNFKYFVKYDGAGA